MRFRRDKSVAGSRESPGLSGIEKRFLDGNGWDSNTRDRCQRSHTLP